MLNPFTHRKILKKGMPGQAVVAEMAIPERGASMFNLPMTLQVHVEGITPYEIEGQWMVKAKDVVGLRAGVPIPVKVDPKDHEKVAIDWDGVREQYTQHKTARQAALASGGSMGSGFGAQAQGAAPVVDMRNDPELRAKIEKVLGRELTPGTTEQVAENDPELQMRIMQVVQEHAAEKAAGSAPATGFGGGTDDSVGKLERLAALRDSGALTDEEFEREKQKILGD